MIEGSFSAVKNGTNIADETAKSFLSVVEGAKEIASSVDKISLDSQNQKRALEELVKNIDLIAQVVQSNTSTVQESVSTSEELSKQSKLLRDLVSKFHLRELK